MYGDHGKTVVGFQVLGYCSVLSLLTQLIPVDIMWSLCLTLFVIVARMVLMFVWYSKSVPPYTWG